MVGKLLAEHAAARRRVADDHMFTVAHPDGTRIGTFRLQLYAAPGARPVAVATQFVGEGAALMNKAEKYAAAVCATFFREKPGRRSGSSSSSAPTRTASS
jgi:hypothetical protein